MAITYKIDTEAGVLYSFAEGEIEAADIREFRERYTNDPLYHPSLLSLFDARSARFLFSGMEAKALADWSKANRPTAKSVVLIDDTNPNQGHVHMFTGWAEEDYNVKIFHDTASAKEWLGLPFEEE